MEIGQTANKETKIKVGLNLREAGEKCEILNGGGEEGGKRRKKGRSV